MEKRHTDKIYDAELNTLKDKIVHLKNLQFMFISDIIINFIEKKNRSVSINLNELRLIEKEINNLCSNLLLTRQPAGSDYRVILTSLKQSIYLEQIDDIILHISKRINEFDSQLIFNNNLFKEYYEVLGEMILKEKESFEKYKEIDIDIINNYESKLNALYGELFRDALDTIVKDSTKTFQMMQYLQLIKYIEKYGDIIYKISFLTNFMISGKDYFSMNDISSIKKDKKSIKGILFVCVHNSGRSQIAEGFAKEIFKNEIKVYSAGTNPAKEVNPLVVKSMKEVGIDISNNKPKRISDVPLNDIDILITLCGEELCFDFRNIYKSESWILPDPASFKGSEEEILNEIAKVRDEIRARIEILKNELI